MLLKLISHVSLSKCRYRKLETVYVSHILPLGDAGERIKPAG